MNDFMCKLYLFTDIIKSGKDLHWRASMWPNYTIGKAYWIAKISNLMPPSVEHYMYDKFSRRL